MHLDTHLNSVADSLQAAASLGDDRTREVAAGLAAASNSAVRLALLGAVSAAADEITAALLDFPGSPRVTVRLDGDDLAIGVDAHPAHADEPQQAADEPRTEDGGTARVSLRLPEHLKAEVDAAAEADGVSVNTWLVRAAAAALRPSPTGPFGPWGAFGGGLPFGRGAHRGGPEHGGGSRISGWVTG